MPILSHNPAHERDHVPAASVAFGVLGQAMPSPAASVDELLDAVEADRRAAAIAQRTEIHVGLSDDLLISLAARAVHGRTGVRS